MQQSLRINPEVSVLGATLADVLDDEDKVENTLEYIDYLEDEIADPFL